MSEISAQGTAPFITGPGNVLPGLKKICLFALGFVIAIDLAHSTLSAVYDPYSGAVDDAMHIVLFAAPAFYVTALFFMLNRLVVVYQCSGWRVLPVVAILVVLGELAFTFLAARRSGSSFYRPMFPDFAAGLIIGGLTAAAAKPYLQSRAMRIFLTALLLLWLGGTIVTDLLWYSEGTQRGTGPLWRIPVLGHYDDGPGLRYHVCRQPRKPFAVWMVSGRAFLNWRMDGCCSRPWLVSLAEHS